MAVSASFGFGRNKKKPFGRTLIRTSLFFNPSEPGLLQALQRRVEAAERTYKAAELDERLNEFEAARKRQVC